RTLHPGPLDDGGPLAGRGGFEPPLRGPEPRVLPLDDLPTDECPPPDGHRKSQCTTCSSAGQGRVSKGRDSAKTPSLTPLYPWDIIAAMQRGRRCSGRKVTARQPPPGGLPAAVGRGGRG